MPEPPPSRLRALAPLAIAAALLAVALLALLAGVSHRPVADVRSGRANAPAALPASTPPPPVTPTILRDLTPAQARADNLAEPFAEKLPQAARPLLFSGSAADRAAAGACLAAAALYEAGDDRGGEQAVAQVVLNRVRHPAFPKTVCGVVFQGSERPTGCQFTFTCDGALSRPPDPAAWERARKVADAALSGFVYRPVGPATHYHADYVVPYWRASLVKLAQVHAHIFYRWPGWWGSAAALSGRPQPFERLDPRLAALAGPEAIEGSDGEPSVLVQTGALATLDIPDVPRAALHGSLVRAKDDALGQYVLQLAPGSSPKSWAVMAFDICGERPDCLLLGWTRAEETPRALPVPPPTMRTLAFMYRKSSVLGIAGAGWDCRRFRRPLVSQCLAGTGPRAADRLGQDVTEQR